MSRSFGCALVAGIPRLVLPNDLSFSDEKTTRLATLSILSFWPAGILSDPKNGSPRTTR